MADGTVTVMFTDLIRSTDLADQHGDRIAADALVRHLALVRRHVERYQGRIVKSLGDGQMVAFDSSLAAVECAVAVQAETPPGDPPARIGINAGEGLDRAGDLFGQAVNAAARICARAEGGQILCAAVVPQLTGTVPGARYRDRGRVRLKGFTQRWHLYEVEWGTAAGPSRVARPRLIERLQGVRGHRLTTIVADAGFGKTALLEEWQAGLDPSELVVVRPSGRDLPAVAGAIVAAMEEAVPDIPEDLLIVVQGGADLDPVPRGEDGPGAVAGMICAVLEQHPGLELVVVIDDAQRLDAPALRFVEGLCRQAPGSLHVVLASRQGPLFPIDRLRDQGGVLELTGTDLAFDDAGVARLLLDRLSTQDEGLISAVMALTGGWPAAVHLAIDTVAERPAEERLGELNRLKRRGGSVMARLAAEVVDRESPEVRQLIQRVAPYDAFSAELAEVLGCHGAADMLAHLAGRGIAMRLGFDRYQWYAFPQLLSDFVRDQLPMGAGERTELLRRAAAWFDEVGQPEGALRCATLAADADLAAQFLRAHGSDLVMAGRARPVVEALGILTPAQFDAPIEELAGEARQATGDTEGALACYQRAARGREQVSPSLAWRVGFIHYQRGELDEALASFEQGGPPSDTPDYALLLSWTATVHWARGQVDAGRRVAETALALAERLDSPRALAAAHTVLAMLAAHEGDRSRNEVHYAQALEYAERARDVTQIIRIRNNRGSRLLEEGDFDGAVEELEVAIELAEACGLTQFRALALANRGEVRFHLGQYDAAVADLEKASDLYRAEGSFGIAFPQFLLGHVYRHRGDLTLSRVAYESAVAAARGPGHIGNLVPALCGLAQLLAETEWERARALSDEALSYEPGLGYVGAMLASGWVALAGADRERAHGLAVEAVDIARRRRDRLGLAEALLLQVVSGDDQGAEDHRLVEAIGLLDQVGAPLWGAQVRLEQARRLGGTAGRDIAVDVEQTAEALGARPLAAKAAELRRTIDARAAETRVSVATLGGFRVRRGERIIRVADWRDDSARALLKRLSARPSLEAARTALARSIWPELGADTAAARLDEAVEHLRASLDPDQTFSADYFLIADGESVALNPGHVDVDIRRFLADAEAGLDPPAGVDQPAARDLLRRAESCYAGDYLEEHPGEQWADALREEARARYVEIARALASDATASGDHEAAARFCRRILERDPYDERAHLALAGSLSAAGRHGEARRCYGIYVQRLQELGLEAIPFPQFGAVPTRVEVA